MAGRRRRKKIGLFDLFSAFTAPATRRRPRRSAGKAGRPRIARSRLAGGRSAARGTRQTARYAGAAGSRGYQIYLPVGLRRTSKVPLVILLHGCLQTPAEFAAVTRFDQLADRNKFVVVYPEQTVTHNMQRCWNWFDARHQGRGHGEPAILAGIARQVMAERSRWRIDADRVYVAGLSAGGAMALVLGATYPDLFAAIGVHSAPPYRSASSRTGALRAMAGRSALLPAPVAGVGAPQGIAPMVVFQGGSDGTVRSVNSVRIVEQWQSFHERSLKDGSDPKRITRHQETTKTSSGGGRYTVTRFYSANGRKMLESWQIERLAHAWSGGAKGAAFSDPDGPRASTEMWRFLSAHHLERGPGGGR